MTPPSRDPLDALSPAVHARECMTASSSSSRNQSSRYHRVMSFDVTWPLRWPTVDVVRFAAAVEAGDRAARRRGRGHHRRRGQSAVLLGRDVAAIRRALARPRPRRAEPSRPRVHREHHAAGREDYPLVAGAPYAVLHETLTDEEYEQPIAGVQALCTIGERVHGVTASGACFVLDGQRWRQLDRDDLNAAGAAARQHRWPRALRRGRRVRDNAGRLVKLPSPPGDLDLRAIAGRPHRPHRRRCRR